MVLNGVLRLFHFTLTSCYLSKQCIPRSDATFCGVWSGFALFTNVLQITALWRHSDKNSAAINNRFLDFIQTRGLIPLVNDNHVDNNLKEILMYVYFCSIVNKTVDPKMVISCSLSVKGGFVTRLLSCTQSLFWKGIYSKRNEFASKESQNFLKVGVHVIIIDQCNQTAC